MLNEVRMSYEDIKNFLLTKERMGILTIKQETTGIKQAYFKTTGDKDIIALGPEKVSLEDLLTELEERDETTTYRIDVIQ